MTLRDSIGSRLSVPFGISIGLFVLCVFLFFLSSTYPTMAKTFPQLVLIMIMIVTIADLYNSICENRKKKLVENNSSQEKTENLQQSRKVVFMAFLMFLFFFLMYLGGIFIGTLLFLLFSGWSLGYRNLKNICISSIIISTSVYVIFEIVMNSFLPKGIIFSLFGG